MPLRLRWDGSGHSTNWGPWSKPGTFPQTLEAPGSTGHIRTHRQVAAMPAGKGALVAGALSNSCLGPSLEQLLGVAAAAAAAVAAELQRQA